jgi:hypothetical protein
MLVHKDSKVYKVPWVRRELREHKVLLARKVYKVIKAYKVLTVFKALKVYKVRWALRAQ